MRSSMSPNLRRARCDDVSLALHLSRLSNGLKRRIPIQTEAMEMAISLSNLQELQVQ